VADVESIAFARIIRDVTPVVVVQYSRVIDAVTIRSCVIDDIIIDIVAILLR
jgi:hypothetical protein